MSDLISRQALLNELEHDLDCFETKSKSEKEIYIAVSDMRRMIEGQQTAYDADKVVEQLMIKTSVKCDNCSMCCYDSAIEEAVDVVKAGGVHE